MARLEGLHCPWQTEKVICPCSLKEGNVPQAGYCFCGEIQQNL